jgi:DNA repair exonuclease SbcCD ATPase subunit
MAKLSKQEIADILKLLNEIDPERIKNMLANIQIYGPGIEGLKELYSKNSSNLESLRQDIIILQQMFGKNYEEMNILQSETTGLSSLYASVKDELKEIQTGMLELREVCEKYRNVLETFAKSTPVAELAKLNEKYETLKAGLAGYNQKLVELSADMEHNIEARLKDCEGKQSGLTMEFKKIKESNIEQKLAELQKMYDAFSNFENYKKEIDAKTDAKFGELEKKLAEAGVKQVPPKPTPYDADVTILPLSEQKTPAQNLLPELEVAANIAGAYVLEGKVQYNNIRKVYSVKVKTPDGWTAPYEIITPRDILVGGEKCNDAAVQEQLLELVKVYDQKSQNDRKGDKV